MQWENWQRDTPPCKVFWARDGYIIGFRYHRDTTAWHITTVQAGGINDYWVADGRFHRILETRCRFTDFSMLFVTDDVEATPESDERTAVLAAIREWEDAFKDKAFSALMS
jgi:hypothetical protein